MENTNYYILCLYRQQFSLILEDANPLRVFADDGLSAIERPD
jgi:hypothetical protein